VKKELAQNIIKESYRASNTLYIMTSPFTKRPRSIVSDSAHPAAYGEPFNGGSMQEVGKVAVGGSWFPNDRQTYQTIPSKNYIRVGGNSLIILELLT
jgi:hypothetical protein